MARDNIFENMPMTEAAPQPKGNSPETLVPWQDRAGGIVVTAVLLLLGLALATSLLAVTLLDLRAQSKLQAVEEAVQKLQVSLQPDDISDASAKRSETLQLLDEAQAGVRLLKAQLGNVSAAYGEIQIRLDNVSAAYGQIQIRLDNVSAVREAVQGHCSDVLTKLSRGWKFYSGNFYYFSQERKSWDEAERFCVSQDSHLTSVSSQAEQEFLSNGTKGEAHWIGLTDRETEGSWRWADGTEYRADASRGGGLLRWGLRRPHSPGQSSSQSNVSPAALLSRVELWLEHGSPVALRPRLEFRPERGMFRGPEVLPKTGSATGFWEENQPDNWDQGTGGREDCVETRTMELKWWNDANCTLPSRWICKQAHGQAGL